MDPKVKTTVVNTDLASKPEALKLNEGTRAELEMRGVAIDATNGRRIVGTGVNDARYEDAK